MSRILTSGIGLLLCGALTARSLPAPASKTEPLVFVFLRVDQDQRLAILRPMIAPDIGVQLDKGPREMKPGTVLRCTTSIREHPAIIEEQKATISELVLDCGEHRFVVKGLDFSQRTK
jgi:hypothetical protein